MNKIITKKRSYLFNIPIDHIQEDEIEDIIKQMLEKNSAHQICFLSFRGYLKAKLNKKYRRMLERADYIVPVSRSLIKAINFLKKGEPIQYMPFEFIIKFLGAIEKIKQTLYLIGSNAACLQRSWNNLKDSFPGIRIIGRHVGNFKKGHEQNIIVAINKAGPACLLIGKGVPGNEKWARDLRPKLKSGIIIYDKSCYQIFSGTKKKPNKKLWNAGLETLFTSLILPWKWFLMFPYLIFYIQILFNRIKNK